MSFAVEERPSTEAIAVFLEAFSKNHGPNDTEWADAVRKMFGPLFTDPLPPNRLWSEYRAVVNSLHERATALLRQGEVDRYLSAMDWISTHMPEYWQRLRNDFHRRISASGPFASVAFDLAGSLIEGSSLPPAIEGLAQRYRLLVVRFPRDRRRDLYACRPGLEPMLKPFPAALAWQGEREWILFFPESSRDRGMEPLCRTFSQIRTMVDVPIRGAWGAAEIASVRTSIKEVRLAARMAPYPGTGVDTREMLAELAVLRCPDALARLAEILAPVREKRDLLDTLREFYGHDMHRGATARALHVHPRTVDYRLRKVCELTGFDPGSPRGVRVFTLAVHLDGIPGSVGSGGDGG